MEVPGCSGYSFLGDESIEFVRTPRDYVDKRRRNYGEVFLGRVLNKPTVFLASNKAVQDLLTGKLVHFSSLVCYGGCLETRVAEGGSGDDVVFLL